MFSLSLSLSEIRERIRSTKEKNPIFLVHNKLILEEFNGTIHYLLLFNQPINFLDPLYLQSFSSPFQQAMEKYGISISLSELFHTSVLPLKIFLKLEIFIIFSSSLI